MAWRWAGVGERGVGVGGVRRVVSAVLVIHGSDRSRENLLNHRKKTENCSLWHSRL